MIRSIGFLVISLLTFFICAAYYSLNTANDNQGFAVVTIKTGETTRSAAFKLEKAEIIKSSIVFEFGARLYRSSIKAGEYKIAKNLSVMDIIKILVEGKSLLYKITIPEGLTLAEIGVRLQDANVVEAEDFYNACREMLTSRRWIIATDSLEGYLFPETYSFVRNVTAKTVVVSMVNQFFKKVEDHLPKSIVNDPEKLNQMVTLASIIEKESSIKYERKLISAVLNLRLEKNIPLQSDPTVIYALPNFKGNIHKKDLSYDSPYNTYLYNGLPPGPISNPGLDSILAAHEPANVDYLYFVSKNNGEHFFSRTLKEHNKAVKIYQIKKKKH